MRRFIVKKSINNDKIQGKRLLLIMQNILKQYPFMHDDFTLHVTLHLKIKYFAGK